MVKASFVDNDGVMQVDCIGKITSFCAGLMDCSVEFTNPKITLPFLFRELEYIDDANFTNISFVVDYAPGDIVKITADGSIFNGLQGSVVELINHAQDSSKYDVLVDINAGMIKGKYTFTFNEIKYIGAITNTTTPDIDNVIPF
jgi:hypothetical protein